MDNIISFLRSKTDIKRLPLYGKNNWLLLSFGYCNQFISESDHTINLNRPRQFVSCFFNVRMSIKMLIETSLPVFKYFAEEIFRWSILWKVHSDGRKIEMKLILLRPQLNPRNYFFMENMKSDLIAKTPKIKWSDSFQWQGSKSLEKG